MARGNTIASAFEQLVEKAHYKLTIIIIRVKSEIFSKIQNFIKKLKMAALTKNAISES